MPTPINICPNRRKPLETPTNSQPSCVMQESATCSIRRSCSAQWRYIGAKSRKRSVLDEEQAKWSIWELRQNETLIGRLIVEDQDMFWYSCRFEPTPAFEPYRSLFAEGQELFDKDDEFTRWYNQINNLGIKLMRPSDGTTAKEYLLYINDSKADFRWL